MLPSVQQKLGVVIPPADSETRIGTADGKSDVWAQYTRWYSLGPSRRERCNGARHMASARQHTSPCTSACACLSLGPSYHLWHGLYHGSSWPQNGLALSSRGPNEYRRVCTHKFNVASAMPTRVSESEGGMTTTARLGEGCTDARHNARRRRRRRAPSCDHGRRRRTAAPCI